MKLDIIFDSSDLDDLTSKINLYFDTEMRMIRPELSLFEQYEIRPKIKKFIPEIWKYRVIKKMENTILERY